MEMIRLGGGDMSENFIPADRQSRIQQLIQEKGIVKVADLSRLFGVTELTIRRDLDVLEKQGILDRTHGGAILRHRTRIETLYTEKDQQQKDEKEAIGKAVSLLMEKEDTLLINTGSTTTQVIRHLPDKRLRVITNNASALVELVSSDIELIITGGLFRRKSNSLIGGFALEVLKNVCGSKAIIGVDGISIRYGLTTPVHQEAEISRTMLNRTEGPVIAVADHSKIGVVSNFVIAPIERVSVLITDSQIDEGYKRELEQLDIKVFIAEEMIAEQQESEG
jgi:DeoR family fructose operon transcriptional repressor